ncbi:MAG: large-conductance mechanosensitive channel protein MscL [Solirubrobacteraceae bacterium]
MSVIKEFKEFISKGNVLDLAIGVVIGGAFGKIVTSMVENLIMPVIGFILGGVNFSEFKYILKEGTQTKNASGALESVGEVAIKYGSAIQSIIDFLIIAFFIFLFVKAINKFKKPETIVEEMAAPSNEEIILKEIRDLLKNK